MDPDIERLFARIEHKADEHKKRHDELTSLLRFTRVAANQGDGTWLPVNRIKLEVGLCYVVRRRWSDGTVQDPRICKWTHSGWISVYGVICITPQSGAMIDVFDTTK